MTNRDEMAKLSESIDLLGRTQDGLVEKYKLAQQSAARWQALCEERILAAVQVLLCMATGSPHGSTMTPLQILEDLEERIIHAGTKGPPLTRLEAPHTCPDDDLVYADDCAGCAAETPRPNAGVPSVYNVDLPEGQWAVEVCGGGEADYKTMFVSGVQGFAIAEYPADGGEEAREACEWFAAQFRTAMRNLGAPPERTPRSLTPWMKGALAAIRKPDGTP